MDKFFKLVGACVVTYIVKEWIKDRIYDKEPLTLVMKVIPGSQSERKFLKIFRDNSSKFSKMTVQLGEVFDRPYNTYIFKMHSKDLGLLDGFEIEF